MAFVLARALKGVQELKYCLLFIPDAPMLGLPAPGLPQNTLKLLD